MGRYLALSSCIYLIFFSLAAVADPTVWRPYWQADDTKTYRDLFHHCAKPVACPDGVSTEVICQNSSKLFTRFGPAFQRDFDELTVYTFAFARAEGDLHYWRVQASGTEIAGPYPGGVFTGHSVMIICD